MEFLKEASQVAQVDILFNTKIHNLTTAVIKKIRSSSGFTLIELLLVIAIISILATATFGAFNKFTRQQNISVATDDVQNALAEAKSNALSHVIKSCNRNTDVFIGYQVRFTPNTRNYYLEEICQRNGNPAAPLSPVVKTYNPLPSGLVFGAGFSPFIRFSALTGGATSGSVNITNSSTSQQVTISVSSGGVIKKN